MTDPVAVKKLTADQRKHSSIQTGGKTINTVAGPIHEWLPIPENLPRHPTMIRDLLFCLCFFLCSRVKHAFFGKRRTGKSTTITNVAYHCCQDIPFGMVMSDTAYAGYWEKIIPKQFIVQGLRQDILDWLIQRQIAAVAKYGIKVSTAKCKCRPVCCAGWHICSRVQRTRALRRAL